MKINEITVFENGYSDFLADLKNRIRKSQYESAKVVNTQIIQLYWEIGNQLSKKQKEGWGKSIIETLSNDIQKEFSGIKGFSPSNLWSMRQFYEEYNENKILQPLVGEISWSKHLVIMSRCKDFEEKRFYILATKKMINYASYGRR